MQAMHEMKLSPVCAAKRTQNRVVEQFSTRPKFFFAACDALIHLQDFRREPGTYLFRRQSSRQRHSRRLSPGRQISQAHHHQRLSTLYPGLSFRQRLIRLRRALKTLCRARVSQIQVLQDFARTPLSRRMLTHQRARQSCNRRLNFFLQPLQKRVHGRLLTFLILSVRMLRDLQNHSTVSQEGCP